jgi:HK97 family phage major capsid protein
MDLSEIIKALGGVEEKMTAFHTKASGEMAANGKVAEETKKALDALGIEQKALADRLVMLEQKGALRPEGEPKPEGWGDLFVKSDVYKDFQQSKTQKCRVEIKNTITNTVGSTYTDRRPGIVGGAFRTLTLEALLNSLPTGSNAVDYVREASFINAAAETAEGALKPESTVTTALVTEPVATIAHWLKISRQLAQDNAALAAYVNTRMVYGVNLRVENQIINGNGTAPNMSGFTKTGNFTPHGYTAAALGAGATRLDLIRRIIGDCAGGDYPADAIVLNPVDWALIETLKDTQGRYLVGDPANAAAPRLWGLPVAVSNAITADNVLVGSMAMAATFYNRSDVAVELSESDGDNFVRNLITVRAERRCMLAVERPAAVRYGDLTPA